LGVKKKDIYPQIAQMDADGHRPALGRSQIYTDFTLEVWKSSRVVVMASLR